MAGHRDVPAEDDEDDEDMALAALEEAIIDLRDCVVRPASADVAVVHLAQMEAAGRPDSF